MNIPKTLLALLILSFTLTGCSRIRTGLLQSSPSSQLGSSGDSESLIEPSTASESDASMLLDQSTLANGAAEKGGLPSARQVDFTSETATKEYAKIGPTIYFFTSPSCASCAQASKDLKENILDLPAGMTIVTVNLDSADALKSTYNVTAAHTFVLIDESGKALSTWQGGGVNEILARF